jgi:hypothetical protein
MTLKLEDQIKDDLQDEVGKCLRALNKVPIWNKDKHAMFDAFLKLAETENYLEFKGDYRDYHLQRKAEHCLYVVPENQRGALQVFAGKKVRVICGGRWNARDGRIFHAKAIS